MTGPGAERQGLDWAAIGHGAARGLLLILPVIGLQLAATAASDDDLPGALVAVLFLGILLAFAAAGARAGSEGRHAPRAHGSLAAVGALLVWLPLRILVAVIGDGGNPVRGIGAAIVFAVGMGAVGGIWGAYRARPTGPVH